MDHQDVREKVKYSVEMRTRRLVFKFFSEEQWDEAAKEQQLYGTHMCVILIENFLKEEMRMPKHQVKRVKICGVFPPKPEPEDYPDTLEVIFGDMESVDLVEEYRQTFYRSRVWGTEEKDLNQIQLSVCPEMKPRYMALKENMKRWREQSPPYKTYMKYDKEEFRDFEVWTRLRRDYNGEFEKSTITDDKCGMSIPKVWESRGREKRNPYGARGRGRGRVTIQNAIQEQIDN